MKVLSTHTAVVTEEEFLSGQGLDYAALFVRGNEGTIFRRLSLKGNRVMLVPAKKSPEKTELSWDLSQFLPAGRLPYSLLLQTVSFFLKVSATIGKTSNLEAFVFLCWSAEKGYFLHVPKQSVGGASVTYHWEDSPDVLLLGDIHSHNTMSSFWSGTDNSDDSKKLGLSGVIGDMKGGQLDFTSKWRFCCGDGVMLDLDPSAIFDLPEAPDEWLTQVSHQYGYAMNSRFQHNAPHLPQLPGSGYGMDSDGSPLGGLDWWEEYAHISRNARTESPLPTLATSAFRSPVSAIEESVGDGTQILRRHRVRGRR